MISIYVKESSVKTTDIDTGINELKDKFINNKLCSSLDFFVVDDSIYENAGTESYKLTTEDIVHERSFILNKHLEVLKYGEEK